MKNILFIFGAVIGFAGLVAVLPLLVMWNALTIQMGLGNYDLAVKIGALALSGFVAIGIGWWMMNRFEK